MKNDFVMPILVLSLICLVISGALAFTDSVTRPVIAEAGALRTESVRLEIIPQATGFEIIEADGLPETVVGAYRTINDVGYIFMVESSGYGGDIQLICGVGMDGKIIQCKTLGHSETQGMGSRITEREYEDQYIGVSGDLDGISAISGATISSKAYVNGIRDALAAFELVKGDR